MLTFMTPMGLPAGESDLVIPNDYGLIPNRAAHLTGTTDFCYVFFVVVLSGIVAIFVQFIVYVVSFQKYHWPTRDL